VESRLNLTVQPTIINGFWEMVTSLSRTISGETVVRSMSSIIIDPQVRVSMRVSMPNNVESKELFPLIHCAVEC
jgi:hypothetical protein